MAQYSHFGPWAAEPWGSFDQLRREMDALLNRFGGAPSGSVRGRGVFPAVNLYETAEAYILTAELPGVSADDIHVALEGSTLTLQGERKIDYQGQGQGEIGLHRRERQAESFHRAFELPATIDADKVEAKHRNGVLMLRLPKAPEHQPRQIAIETS